MAARRLEASDAYMRVLISGARPARLQAMRDLLGSLRVDAEIAQNGVQAAASLARGPSMSF